MITQQIPAVPPAPVPRPIDPATVPSAPSVLLLGPPGSGKTHSLSTIVEAGLKLFVIITEPNGLETLLDSISSKGLPLSNVHYRIISPARPGFDSLLAMATKVTQFNFEALSKMSPTVRANAQFLTVLQSLRDFSCERTGTAFGDVSKFGPDCAVAIDSLSGVNIMAMDLTVGDKVTAHMGEWGVAMGMLDKFILALTSNLKALLVLTAHVEPERDETTGAVKLMASTLGRKLAPKIPRFFSEVVLASNEGEKYYWHTSAHNIDLKHRALKLGSKLDPTFKPVIEAYKNRLEAVKVSKQ